MLGANGYGMSRRRVSVDSSAPSIVSATINATGSLLTVVWDTPTDESAITPANWGLTGTLGYIDSTGTWDSSTTIEIPIRYVVSAGEAVTLDVSADEVLDTTSTHGNATISGFSVTNNSTVPALASSGVVMHFSADLGVTLASGRVSAHADNAAGNDRTQATSGKRPYYTAANAAFNGRATIDFVPGDATTLASGALSGGVVSQPHCNVYVLSLGSNANGCFRFDAGVGGLNITHVTVNRLPYLYAGTGYGDAAPTPPDLDEACILVEKVNGASTEWTYYVDGHAPSTDTIDANPGANGYSTSDIGGRTATSYYQDFSLAEEISWDHIPSSGDLDDVVDRLKTMFNIATI